MDGGSAARARASTLPAAAETALTAHPTQGPPAPARRRRGATASASAARGNRASAVCGLHNRAPKGGGVGPRRPVGGRRRRRRPPAGGVASRVTGTGAMAEVEHATGRSAEAGAARRSGAGNARPPPPAATAAGGRRGAGAGGTTAGGARRRGRPPWSGPAPEPWQRNRHVAGLQSTALDTTGPSNAIKKIGHQPSCLSISTMSLCGFRICNVIRFRHPATLPPSVAAPVAGDCFCFRRC